MTSGGMYLAYGVVNLFIGSQSWVIGRSTAALFFVSGSFHITLIIGAIVTSLLYNQVDVLRIHVRLGIKVILCVANQNFYYSSC